MGNQQTFQPTWALIEKPDDYSTEPAPGKIESIWNKNYKSLYHRLSPYSTYATGDTALENQPFYYVYIDEANKDPQALRKNETRISPVGSLSIDAIRISKFLDSGDGSKFLDRQKMLQSGNSFNETQTYDKTSILAATKLGSNPNSRPIRFTDTSEGTPPGTATSALKDGPLYGIGGKGLIRAATANLAKTYLESKWATGKKPTSVTSLFTNSTPASQDGIEYRSDEGAYGLMIEGGNSKFGYSGAGGYSFDFNQLWIGGGKTTRKEGQYTSKASRIFVKYSNGYYESYQSTSTNGFSIPDLGSAGYDVNESSDTNKPGYRYGDAVGKNAGTSNASSFENSDIMIQYKFYSDKSQTFPSKDPESNKTKKVSETLNSMLEKIRTAGYQVTPDSVILRNTTTKYNYDRLFDTRKLNDTPKQFQYGALNAYRKAKVPMVDNTIADGNDLSKKLPTNGTSDSINTLKVLDKDKKTNVSGWSTWSPYKDDLVALYFYDVVNKKYIPFRAAIKGLSESGNASWEELPFVGRADKIYSYGGFNRNLGFTLHIVISSINELVPTWQRINYMTTAIKPSNYTTDTYGGVTNRFMVPPMFMLTLGDMYRDQPVLVQSPIINIPDDASWEIINEENSGEGNWDYLASTIKKTGIVSGQLPREVEIQFSLILLEKERALVGGANFGHAPRTEKWEKWNRDTVPDGRDPKKLYQEFVVDVIQSSATSTATSVNATPSISPVINVL